MDRFFTKIKLKNDISANEIFNLIKSWVEESPHYKVKLEYDLKEEYFRQDFGSENIAFLKSTFNDDEIFACHFVNEEPNNIWITDYIHIKNEDENYLFVNLSCKSQSYSNKLPRQHKPHIIKMIMEKGYATDHGLFPIIDKAIILEDDYVDLCAEIMNGQKTTNLPVVYVSVDPFNSKPYLVNVSRLAVKLSGVAHVLVEPNKSFANKIKKLANHCNAFNGYVGVYFPNTQYREIVSPYLNDKKLSESELENSINDLVLQACINHANIFDWNWNNLLIEYNKRKYEAQKIQADDTIKESKELEDLVDVYAQEKDTLKEKVKELQKQLDNKSSQLEMLKAKCDDKKLIAFEFDGVEEFYTHELHDAVLFALNYYLERVSKDSRVYELLSRLIEKNQVTDFHKKLLDDIKEALKEKSIEKRRKKLENCGFIIECGSHDKLLFNGNEKYMFIMSNSPSDYRENTNLLSDIKRKIDITKKF